MPLPDAPDYSKRIYELLKETDLENLSYAQFQGVAEKLFIEPENEDEMRRLVLVQLARMAVRGDWDGFLTGGGGSGGAPTDAEYVVMALNGTLTDERVLTAGSRITITDGGAGGNVTIAADASPVTSLVAGTNITLSPVSGLGDVTITAAGGSVSFPLEGSAGSVSAPTYSFSGDTNTGMYAPSANTLGFTVGGNERLNVANNKVTGIAFQTSGTNNAAFPDYQFTADPDTGMFKAAPNQIGFATGGSERFRFSDGGAFGIGGATYGTSGQVLTSGGPTSPPTWSTASGGSSNAFEKILPQVGSMSAANQYNVAAAAPWGGGQYVGQAISSMGLGARPYAFPFIAPETGTVSAVGLVVTTADSGINVYVGIYEQNSNNLPSTRLGYATVSLTSTGTIYSTAITGTISLTAGEQYWYSISTDANVFNGIVSSVSTASGVFSAMPLGVTDDIADLNYSIKDTTTSANAVPPSTYSNDDLDGSAGRIVVGLKF